MAEKALQLIAWAPGQWYLTIPELCEAISISEATTSMDAGDLIDVDEVTRHCSSLIRTSQNGRYLEFAHFTVREFLEADSLLSTNLSRFHRSDDRARDLLAEAGLRFLNFAEFSNNLERGKRGIDNLKRRNKSHPLYYYVCRYLPLALSPRQLDNPKIFDLLKQLFGLTKSQNLVAWSLNFALYCVGNMTLSPSRSYTKRYGVPVIVSSGSSSDSDTSKGIDYPETVLSAFLRVDFTALHFAASLGLL